METTNALQGLKPGALLRHDTYRIERVLGQGGFGITYLATDTTLERFVAIKEFFPKDYCDRDSSTSHVTLGTQNTSEFVRRLKAKFLKEARNIAKFDHPGIIKIHAAFEENNTAYYVMDFIEGESLSEIVKSGGPIPVEKGLRYMEKVGRALDYVHSQRINHLDIKPANIMIRRSDDNPILIDFGLSKQYDSTGNQTSTTPTGITHGYAPMEQYADGGIKEFSPRTDLYSLAATLYYILSGVKPPQATKLIEDELTFPASIPTALIPAISKAMAPMRKNRHASVAEFVDEICGSDQTQLPEEPAEGPEAEDAPLPSTDTSQIPAPEKGKSRKWLYAGIVAAVAIIGAIIALVATGRGDAEGQEAGEDGIASQAATESVPQVVDYYWESPLGTASYTGDVSIDPETGEKLPNGKGVAKITYGQYKGSVYDGEFVDGNMEGEAVYTLSNGDVFRGTYRLNQYHDGRYTIKSTGEYFEGSFKNGNPDQGSWHDKSGHEL